MGCFGGERWLAHGEVFTAVFGTFARFAPLDMRTGDSRQLWLRPFGAGLLDSRDVSTSMMAFVLLLLAAVLYDGALATPEWGKLEGAIAPYLSTLGDLRLVTIRPAAPISLLPLLFGS